MKKSSRAVKLAGYSVSISLRRHNLTGRQNLISGPMKGDTLFYIFFYSEFLCCYPFLSARCLTPHIIRVTRRCLIYAEAHLSASHRPCYFLSYRSAKLLHSCTFFFPVTGFIYFFCCPTSNLMTMVTIVT